MFHFEVFEWVKKRGRPPSGKTRKPAYTPVLIDKSSQRCKTEPGERELRMKEMFESGITLNGIGVEFGVSRERVRQLLKKYFGITRVDGGCFVMTTPKKIADAISLKSRRNYRYQKRYAEHFFCDVDQFLAINGDHWTQSHRKNCKIPASAYFNQKAKAKDRKVNWNISFPEWWKVWQESGYWSQRGRGKGYCMTRIGDTGGYEVGNVEIKTIGQNASDSYLKHSYESRRLKVIENRQRMSELLIRAEKDVA